MGSIFDCLVLSAPIDDFEQTRGAGFKRADLRLEISSAFRAASHIGENQFHDVCAHLTCADQANRRNPNTLAINVRCQSHRARSSAADVGVMRAVGDEEKTGGS